MYLEEMEMDMRIASDTRDRLLETATDLLVRSNYQSVGVNEICKQAGVTKGGFYHHFESKAALFEAACQRQWEIKQAMLDSVFSPRFSPLEQLENLIEHVLGKQQEQKADGKPICGCPFFASGAVNAGDDELVRKATAEMASKSVRYYTHLIRSLKAENCLIENVVEESIARQMYQYLHGLFLFARVFQDYSIIENDLRQGLYRILAIRPELQKPATNT